MSPRKPPPGGTPSWFTSLAWFLEFERELLECRQLPRAFDLDAFGHPGAPVSRLIRRRGGIAFGPGFRQRDALAASWARRVVFVQPPYDATSMLAALERTTRAVRSGEVDGAAGLFPATTGLAWFQRHVEADRLRGLVDVRFLPGRQKFGWPGNPEGRGGFGPRFASVTVCWPRRGAQLPLLALP